MEINRFRTNTELPGEEFFIDEMYKDKKCVFNPEKYANAIWVCPDAEIAISWHEAKDIFPKLLADAFFGNFNRTPSEKERKNIMTELDTTFLRSVILNIEHRKQHNEKI